MKSVHSEFTKRTFDLFASLAMLLFLSPLMLIVSVGIVFSLGRPALFRQLRGGYRQEPFEILKFRTMIDETNGVGELLSEEKRLTKFGRFLRSTSLDELPSLLNVIRGEMSLVGPRPLIYEYMPLYTPEQNRRHEVRPGITGWAQINGRNTISWEEKFALDVWYVDHWSFCLDVKIIAITIAKICQREGINQEGCTTAPLFTGTRQHHEQLEKNKATQAWSS